MSSNLQNPLEYLEISALRGVDSLLNKVPQFYKQQVIGQSHRNTQQSENSQSKDKAALLNVGSLLTGQAQTKEQTQTEVVAFVEDTPATLQTSPPNTATTESCLCACTQCLNLQASPADTKTDRAEFKTSTSFGGGFNGSPLKWSQPNGKGSNIDITYSFTKNIKIPGLNTNQVKSLFTEALSTWSEYAPLNFKEIADPGNGRDVDIRVGSEFIDGRSNTLAFAYFPGGGDITFDSGDSWNNSLFLETAVHEIGHSLGLAHEEGVSAIMNPTIANRYAGQTDAFLLQDDINGIVSLYGRGKGSVQTLGQPTPPTPDPDPTPAPNPDPTPKPKPNGRNFVRNGSFEKSDVPKNEFGVFQQVKGWTTISGSGIQIDKRRNVFGEAAKGRSWAELDSNSNSTISQQLRTKEGKSYQLSFQYSPRQGLSAATNGIEVYWDDKLIDKIAQRGGSSNQWQEFSYNLLGGNRSELSFKAVGPSDSVGGFIDAVAVRVNSAAQLGSAEKKEDPLLATNSMADTSLLTSSILGEGISAPATFI